MQCQNVFYTVDEVFYTLSVLAEVGTIIPVYLGNPALLIHEFKAVGPEGRSRVQILLSKMRHAPSSSSISRRFPTDQIWI